MREIGTPKIGSHIKRPRITVNQRIGSTKKAISGSHICEIADKKTTYNEGCLYVQLHPQAKFLATPLDHTGNSQSFIWW